MKKRLIISLVLFTVLLTLIFGSNAIAQSSDKVEFSFAEDSGDYTRTVSLKQSDTDEDFTCAYHCEYGWLTVQEDGCFTYELDADNADLLSAREEGRTLRETVTARFEDENDVKRVCNTEFIIQPEKRDVRTGRYAVLNDGNAAIVEGRFFKEVDKKSGKDEPELISVLCRGGEYEIDDDEFTYTLNNWLRAVQALSKGEKSNKTLVLRLTGSKGTVINKNIEITVTGANDSPTVKSYTYSLLQTDTNEYIGNVLTDSTLGDGYEYQHKLSWDSVIAHYGMLDIDNNGRYSYTLDPTCDAVRALTEGQTLTETFTYTYKDKDGSKADGSVTVNIDWADLMPTVHSFEHTLTEDIADVSDKPAYTYTIGSVLSTAAPGNGTAKQHSFSWLDDAKTDYGVVTLGMDGAFSFTLNTNLPIVQALYPEKGDVEQCYRYSYKDADGDEACGQVKITIHGQNDAPLAASVMADVEEDGNLTASGNVTDGCILGDGTREQHTMVWGKATSNYGTITRSSDGSYSYELNNSLAAVQALCEEETLTEVFPFTIIDINGAESVSALTVTIYGANDVPTIKSHDLSLGLDGWDGYSGSVLAGSTLGDGSADEHSFKWTNTDVKYGTLTANADATFIYEYDKANEQVRTLKDGESLKDIIQFSYTDKDGDEAISTCTFIINYGNIRPKVKYYSHEFTEDSGADGNSAEYTYIITDVLLGSTLGNGTKAQHSFAWESSPDSKYGKVTLGSDGTFKYVLENDSSNVQELYPGGTVPQEVFSYIYEDCDGSSVRGTVTIKINGSNDAPTIQSFTHSLTEDSAAVTVSGNALTGAAHADSSDQSVSFKWDSAAATDYGTVTLSNDGTYSFTLDNSLRAVQALRAAESVDEVFSYTYTDESGAVACGSVTITINGINDKPVATDQSWTIRYADCSPGDAFGCYFLRYYTVQLGDGENTVTGYDSFVSAFKNLSFVDSVSFSPEGIFSFRLCSAPYGSYHDSFTYTITDVDGETSSATFTFDLIP